MLRENVRMTRTSAVIHRWKFVQVLAGAVKGAIANTQRVTRAAGHLVRPKAAVTDHSEASRGLVNLLRRDSLDSDNSTEDAGLMQAPDSEHFTDAHAEQKTSDTEDGESTVEDDGGSKEAAQDAGDRSDAKDIPEDKEDNEPSPEKISKEWRDKNRENTVISIGAEVVALADMARVFGAKPAARQLIKTGTDLLKTMRNQYSRQMSFVRGVEQHVGIPKPIDKRIFDVKRATSTELTNANAHVARAEALHAYAQKIENILKHTAKNAVPATSAELDPESLTSFEHDVNTFHHEQVAFKQNINSKIQNRVLEAAPSWKDEWADIEKNGPLKEPREISKKMIQLVPLYRTVRSHSKTICENGYGNIATVYATLQRAKAIAPADTTVIESMQQYLNDARTSIRKHADADLAHLSKLKESNDPNSSELFGTTILRLQTKITSLSRSLDESDINQATELAERLRAITHPDKIKTAVAEHAITLTSEEEPLAT